MTQPYKTVEQILSFKPGEGVPPFFNKHKRPGDSVSGEITEVTVSQVRSVEDNELKFYKSGKPAMQIVVTLQTTLRSPDNEEDDGRRRLFIKEYSQARDALAEALEEAGAAVPEVGGVLTDTFIGEGVPLKKGMNGENLHKFHYVSPAGAMLNPNREASKETRQESAPKETRPAAAPETRGGSTAVEAMLEAAGLPVALAAALGDEVTPELIQALKNRAAK